MISAVIIFRMQYTIIESRECELHDWHVTAIEEDKPFKLIKKRQETDVVRFEVLNTSVFCNSSKLD